ncbi:MAG TPA: hypothetical protein DCF84_02460 [Bacteroidetes bacterium]|nr:hypothetical protein [Bacteroidota bacterium]|tara:strand:- start:138 stop:470 length:333 start_codon:yes stop_codon:yes gene_type:complete
MKYLSIVFVAAITLVSCGGGMETACDCVDAMAALDQEDTAAVAEWTAANGEACDALMADTTQDMSACSEVATEEAPEAVEAVVEEVVEVVEEVVDSAAAAVEEVVAEVTE